MGKGLGIRMAPLSYAYVWECLDKVKVRQIGYVKGDNVPGVEDIALLMYNASLRIYVTKFIALKQTIV